MPHTVPGDFTGDHWLATFAVLALDGPPVHAGTWRPAAAGDAVD
ncbi:hypothetical protein ACTPOK_37390 [Streptomyces inhibens]